jgi:hypothetical protein
MKGAKEGHDMPPGNDSLKQINEQNTLFWSEQSELILKQVSDETVFKLATKDMAYEALIGIPVRFRKSFEKAVFDAENNKSTVQADFSRKGGRARKSGALRDLILEILRRRPAITPGQLLFELEGPAGAGVVTHIESEADVRAGETRKIHYVDYDGRPKTASVSGLKYCLARAKGKIGLH